MPASRSFLRWWESGRLGDVEQRDELADADLARVLAQHVDELQPDRVAERLGDLGHALGLLALDVGVDDRLAARLARPGASASERAPDRRPSIYIYRLKLMIVNGYDAADADGPVHCRSLAAPRAEGLAAFALVFAGCGAIVADDAVRRRARDASAIGLVFGLVIMVMVYATGHLSGAHINPAVTVAFTLTRHFPRRDAARLRRPRSSPAPPPARSLLLAVWTDQPASLGATVPSVGVGSAFVYEVVLTAFLMFVIMAVATDTRAVGAAAAIAIGGTVGLDALFGGPVTGAIDEPGALASAPRWRRRVDRLLGLRRRPGPRRGGRRVRLPARPWRAECIGSERDRDPPPRPADALPPLGGRAVEPVRHRPRADAEQWRGWAARTARSSTGRSSSLMVAEERITTQFSGLVGAYGREEEATFLATQQVDEARHMQFYARFQDEVVADPGDDRRARRARPRAALAGLRDDLRRGARAGPRAARARARRTGGEGRVRNDLPPGHRGDARPDRVQVHHPLPREREGCSRASSRATARSTTTRQRHIGYGVWFLREAVARASRSWRTTCAPRCASCCPPSPTR